MIRFLRQWKWYIYYCAKPLYTKFFAQQLKRDDDVRQLAFYLCSRTLKSVFTLDPNKAYFVFHASYGDKWMILSLLSAHLKLYAASSVIASTNDKRLAEIFLGKEAVAERFLFVEPGLLDKLSSIFQAVSAVSLPLANPFRIQDCGLTISPYFWKSGLPPGSIRHLHIVNYPYFNDLYHLHAVSYGKLLKALLYLPPDTKPVNPSFYNSNDNDTARQIAGVPTPSSRETARPRILYNIVNISHLSLSDHQVSIVLSELENSGYHVLINTTLANGLIDLEQLRQQHPDARFIEIPSHLMALVCNHVSAVVGVLGGALSVAVQCSAAHVLSLQTTAKFVSFDDTRIYAEWSGSRLWQWIQQDWPSSSSTRVLENVYVGDPALLTDDDLMLCVRNFAAKLNGA